MTEETGIVPVTLKDDLHEHVNSLLKGEEENDDMIV